MPYTQTPMLMPQGAVSSAPQMVAPMKIPTQAAPGVSPDAMQQLAKALMAAKSRRLLNTAPVAQGTAMSDAGSATAPPPLAPNLSGAAPGPMYG